MSQNAQPVCLSKVISPCTVQSFGPGNITVISPTSTMIIGPITVTVPVRNGSSEVPGELPLNHTEAPACHGNASTA